MARVWAVVCVDGDDLGEVAIDGDGVGEGATSGEGEGSGVGGATGSTFTGASVAIEALCGC